MIYRGLQFTNKADKTVEIDIEGYIGWDPWDSPEDQIHTKEKMKAELKKIAQLTAETIIVNINSYGGDVNHGLSIHDLLAENKARIITKVNGMTASSATIIAMAGDERRMSDNALFLVHNASSIAWGDKNDVNTIAEELKKIDDRLANIYSKVTGKEKQEMLDLMNEDKGRGKWLSANEAKKLGFITEVFEPLQAAAVFSNDILQKHQLPPVPGNSVANEEKNNANNIANLVINEIKKIFQSNKPKATMKQFEAINKALGVEEMASTDEGVFMNEDQLSTLDTLLAQTDKNTADLKNAQEAQTKAQADLDAANQSIQAKDAEIADLRQTAGAVTAKAVSEKETISDTDSKDGNVVNEKKSFVENMAAVADEFDI